MVSNEEQIMAEQKPDRGFYQKYFRDIDVVHGLQTKPEDREWLLSLSLIHI